MAMIVAEEYRVNASEKLFEVGLNYRWSSGCLANNIQQVLITQKVEAREF